MVNIVILLGRLGKDPIINPAGKTQVAKLSVATEEKRKDQSGSWTTKTEWHNIQAWGKLAEVCERYLRKGSLVYIEGKIQTDEWDDKRTGEKRRSTEVIAKVLHVLDKPGFGDNDNQDTPRGTTPDGMIVPDEDPAGETPKARLWQKMQGVKMTREEAEEMHYWAVSSGVTDEQLIQGFDKYLKVWRAFRASKVDDDDIPF